MFQEKEKKKKRYVTFWFQNKGLSEEFSDEDLSAVLPTQHVSHLENTHFV